MNKEQKKLLESSLHEAIYGALSKFHRKAAARSAKKIKDSSKSIAKKFLKNLKALSKSEKDAAKKKSVSKPSGDKIAAVKKKSK